MTAIYDSSLDDFPRLGGENDDSPRFLRAVQACPSGVLYVPAGVYEVASPIVVSNLCSLLLHKSAILRAVREMEFVLTIDNRMQWDGRLRAPGMPEDYNLFLRGGQIDGNGLASCVFIFAHHHFTYADQTALNGRECGVRIGHGYEMMATNVYCKTVMRGLAGNVGFDILGGDSHYTDIVVIDYTIGMRLAPGAWTNRLTRCHVWGGPVPPAHEGEPPEMLRDSICFDVREGCNLLRDCYADTGKTGFRIEAPDTRMDGCFYYSNPTFKLDGIVCIRHVSGALTIEDMHFSKTAPSVTVYEGCGDVTWRDCRGIGFAPSELPFTQEGSSTAQLLS